MKLKRLKNPKTGDVSIGILHEAKWLILKDLLSVLPSNENCKFEPLKNVSDNIVTFLGNKEINEKLTVELIKKTANLACNNSEYVEEIIPFKPKAYRDFMIFEKHVVNASRNAVKLTSQQKYEEILAYEKETGEVHEALKPVRLWYEKPIYYMGNHMSFVTGSEEIYWPSYTNILDYELELGVLIVKPLLNALPEEARKAIGGFVVLNDFSARDVQKAEMDSGFGPAKSKNFRTSISSCVVTADEVLPFLNGLNVRVYINEQLISEGIFENPQHTIEEAIAYASLGENVYPGEIIGSGTIPNCCGLENSTFLKLGDVIRLEFDKVGQVTNKIADKMQ